MSLYDTLFSQFGIPISQILLTKENLTQKSQYKNARSTLLSLLKMNVLPIINENDTISSAEIRFGDNDALASVASGLICADYLILLTDVDALYTSNPKIDPGALRIPFVKNSNDLSVSTKGGSSLGTGGMASKLLASEIASSRGVTTIITNSPASIPLLLQNHSNFLKSLDENELSIGTTFQAHPRLNDTKFHIRTGMTSKGSLVVNEGAYAALLNHNSLFAAGIINADGDFTSSQCLDMKISQEGVFKTIGKCLVNYNSKEIQAIKGLKSSEISSTLGYIDEECVAHRDNIVLYS